LDWCRWTTAKTANTYLSVPIPRNPSGPWLLPLSPSSIQNMVPITKSEVWHQTVLGSGL
jgi:hypothetical protein